MPSQGRGRGRRRRAPPPPPRVVELWDSNSHVTQEHMEGIEVGGSSIVSLVSVYLVYSLQL